MENITPSGTYNYSFHVSTPNVNNAYGIILSDRIYQGGNGQWYRPIPVYKSKNDVISYQQYVAAAGYICLIIVEVVSLTNCQYQDDIPTFNFHNQIYQINLAESIRREALLANYKVVHGTDPRNMILKDANYLAKDDLSITDTILKKPYTDIAANYKPNEYYYN